MVTGGSDLRDTTDWTQNARMWFILGVMFLGLGIMPLLTGLYGYYVTVPEVERADESVKEAAEEQGLDGIPGISVDDNLARLFTFMILAGGFMTVIGAVLLTAASYGKSRCAEKRP